MPLYDRHTLEGGYSVEASVRMVRNYRYAEEHMMRIIKAASASAAY
jgi:hypothetical protein